MGTELLPIKKVLKNTTNEKYANIIAKFNHGSCYSAGAT